MKEKMGRRRLTEADAHYCKLWRSTIQEYPAHPFERKKAEFMMVMRMIRSVYLALAFRLVTDVTLPFFFLAEKV